MHAYTHDSYDSCLIRMFTFKNEQSKVVWQRYAAFTISMQQTYQCCSRVRIFFMVPRNNFELNSATFLKQCHVYLPHVMDNETC